MELDTILKIASFGWIVLIFFVKWLWDEIQTCKNAANAAANAIRRDLGIIEKEFTAHRLKVASDYFNKAEVKDIVDGMIQPLKDDIHHIRKSVDKLVDKMNGNGNGG